jgi:hypothetical protein
MVLAPVADGVNVTWQAPPLSVQLVVPNEPAAVVLVHVTCPVGVKLAFVVSVTVAVQVTAVFTTAGFGTQLTLVAVESPVLTATEPLLVSRLKKPAHVAPPGMQSLMLDENDAEASVWPLIAMTCVLAPSAERGNAASRNTAAPFAHGWKLQLCWAVPVVVRVPMGRSTVTVGLPWESTITQPIVSVVLPPPVIIWTENPSLEILLLLAVRFSSQRTYTLLASLVMRSVVMSPEPPPASVGGSVKTGIPAQSDPLPSIVMVVSAA